MKGGRSAMLQTFSHGGRSAMLQIFRGEVCNVADLPEGGGGGLQYNTGNPSRGRSFHCTLDFKPGFYEPKVFVVFLEQLQQFTIKSHSGFS